MESSNSEAQNIGPPSVDRREGGPYTVVGNDLERNAKDLPKKQKTEDETMATCSSHHSAVGVAVRLLFCFLAGIVFGVAFEKSRGKYSCILMQLTCEYVYACIFSFA